jgi:hypothetical protein
MAWWLSFEEAVRQGADAAELRREIDAARLPSYCDERGRRYVWRPRGASAAPAAREEARAASPGPSGDREELATLTRTVRRLEAQLGRLVAGLERRAPKATPASAGPRPPKSASSARPKAGPSSGRRGLPGDFSAESWGAALADMPCGYRSTIELAQARWRGSYTELEQRAGLPRFFLSKARRGQRNGPRAAGSWEKLRACLEGLEGTAREAA